MKRGKIETPDGVLVPYIYGTGYTVHPASAGRSGAQAFGKGFVFTKAEGMEALRFLSGMPRRGPAEAAESYRQRVALLSADNETRARETAGGRER